MQVAMHALDRETFAFHGREIGAARDEENVVAGGRHARAEIAADRARRHDRYSHSKILRSLPILVQLRQSHKPPKIAAKNCRA
jgi:hypothetical protein